MSIAKTRGAAQEKEKERQFALKRSPFLLKCPKANVVCAPMEG
jgi:hypothetical protein